MQVKIIMRFDTLAEAHALLKLLRLHMTHNVNKLLFSRKEQIFGSIGKSGQRGSCSYNLSK